MRNSIDKMALSLATILISALPLTIDAAEVTDKTKKQHSTMVKNKVKTCLDHRENSSQSIDINALKSRFDRGLD